MPTTCSLQGATDTADATSRIAIASEIDQIIQGIKETANASYGDKYIMSGTATSVAPYKLGDDDTYQGNLGGLDPAVPGIVREIGPGVTMTINSVAVEILGEGRANPTDGKLLNVAARHLRPPEGQRRRRAARHRHDRPADTVSTRCSRSVPATARRPTASTPPARASTRSPAP